MDIKSYETFIHNLNKDIEDKTIKLDSKEKELKEVSSTSYSARIWDKEKSELMGKYGGLEKEVQRLGGL